MKKLIYMLTVCPLLMFGQQPIINSISPISVEVGQTVAISGSGLNGVTQVFFGGVSVNGADVNVISDNLIEAIVPAGVTFGPITVLNTTSDLIAQSTEQFYISFDGSAINNFDPEVATSTSVTDVNDLCICDLDGDGRNDIIIAHNVLNGLTPNANREISIFRNQSTSTTPDFSDLIALNNAVNLDGFIATTCGDLDNDGKPELIFTTNNATLSRHAIVYQNNSPGPGTITMDPLNSLIIRLPNTSGGANRIPRKIRIGDMDGDGKKDLVIGNDADRSIHIFQNQSTGPGNFSFPADTEITSGDDHSGLIYLVDLDNDGREDIISAPFRDQAELGSSSVYLIKNNSIIDNLSFSFEGSISNGNQRISNIIAGDFNEDGLNDVIISSSDGGSINIARNTTSGGSISFVADESFSGIGTPFGLSLGDMNGDGRIDLVSSLAAQDILIYENNSTANDIAFDAPVSVSTSNTTREVCVGDLNQDAKPDIAYALDINSGTDGKFGVLTNENQIVPVINPSTGDYCRTPEMFTISATKSTSSPLAPTYNWSFVPPTDGNIVGTGDVVTAEITSLGPNVTIQLSIDQDGTSGSSMSQIVLGVITDTQPAAPIISDPGVICAGDPVTLAVTLPGNYDELEWTLPDGSSVSTTQIVIGSASIDDAGNYQVKGKTTGGCFSEESVAFGLQVSSPPLLEVLNNGNDVFCADAANDPLLEVSDIAGFTYQWRRNTTDIAGATNATYTATESGDYTVEVTDANACAQITSAYTVTEVSLPDAIIAGPTETCVNFETTFTANSTVQSGFTPLNSWTVEDASNLQIGSSNTDELVFTFPAVGTYEVILTTRYDPTLVASCEDMLTQVVTVSPEPTITFNVSDGAEKCQLDGLTVSVTSPDAATITDYNWVLKNALDLSEIPNSQSTNASINATTPIGVDSVYAVVTVTTNIGCQVTDSVLIQNFPTDIDISSNDFDLSSNSVTLEDDNFIVLNAENVTDPAWSPNAIIDDTTAARVTVFPSQPETTITLTGTDANGCLVASTLTIILDNIRPRRTFSPNGDNLGFDCWEILNTSTLEGCKVFVFDSRGRNILVEDSPFIDNCVWDGNFNGSPVPEGIYYFVLKCNDDNLSKTGSIMLAR